MNKMNNSGEVLKMNRVIAGDYKGKGVLCPLLGKPQITLPMFKTLEISRETVESYEVQNEVSQMWKNANRFFTKDKYRIAINFKDGKRSLLEVDERIFGIITKELF